MRTAMHLQALHLVRMVPRGDSPLLPRRPLTGNPLVYHPWWPEWLAPLALALAVGKARASHLHLRVVYASGASHSSLVDGDPKIIHIE
jgi:hypothetical protein